MSDSVTEYMIDIVSRDVKMLTIHHIITGDINSKKVCQNKVSNHKASFAPFYLLFKIS